MKTTTVDRVAARRCAVVATQRLTTANCPARGIFSGTIGQTDGKTYNVEVLVQRQYPLSRRPRPSDLHRDENLLSHFVEQQRLNCRQSLLAVILQDAVWSAPSADVSRIGSRILDLKSYSMTVCHTGQVPQDLTLQSVLAYRYRLIRRRDIGRWRSTVLRVYTIREADSDIGCCNSS